MTDTRNSKFLAILFADIEGYTAIMQKNVEHASKIIRRFQKELEKQVVDNRGILVNFYGDGALCTFQTPIETVRCAMKLQSSYYFIQGLGETTDKIATIRNNRVAVLTFQNRTGDKTLDFIGEMTAEWITRALIETKEAKVVNQSTVQSSILKASIIPGVQLGEKDLFSKATNAKHIIRGSYYKEGNQLLFSSQVDDASNGSVQFAFEEFIGDVNKPSTLINEMKNRIAEYWKC